MVWNENSIKFLKDNINNLSNQELADSLGTTKSSITAKLRRLGLRREDKNIKDDKCKCYSCKRWLPWEYEYFPKGKGDRNPRRQCRECNPKYGRFLINGKLLDKHPWSEEDDKILSQYYSSHTNKEICEMFFKDTLLTPKRLSDRAGKLGLSKGEEWKSKVSKIKSDVAKVVLVGREVTQEEKSRRIATIKRAYANGYVNPQKGKTLSVSHVQGISKKAKERGQWKGCSNPRHITPLFGESNGRWEGGITSLSTALREVAGDWKRRSIIKCNGKCVITGEPFDEVHHLTPFNKIVKIALNTLNLDVKSCLGDYSDSDREKLVKLVIKLHDKEGVCLIKQVHKDFHDRYGYIDSTEEDFIEFSKDYKKD